MRAFAVLSLAVVCLSGGCWAAFSNDVKTRIAATNLARYDICAAKFIASPACNNDNEPFLRRRSTAAIKARFMPSHSACGTTKKVNCGMPNGFCVTRPVKKPGTTTYVRSTQCERWPFTTGDDKMTATCGNAIKTGCFNQVPFAIYAASPKLSTQDRIAFAIADTHDACLWKALPTACAQEPMMVKNKYVFQTPTRDTCPTRAGTTSAVKMVRCDFPAQFCMRNTQTQAIGCGRYPQPLTAKCQAALATACAKYPRPNVYRNYPAFKTPTTPPTKPVVPPKPPVKPVVPPKPPVKPVVPPKPVAPKPVPKPPTKPAPLKVLPLFPPPTPKPTLVAPAVVPVKPAAKVAKVTVCFNAINGTAVTCKGTCRPKQDAATLQYRLTCVCGYKYEGPDCARKRKIIYPSYTQRWMPILGSKHLDPSKNTTATRSGRPVLGIYYTQSFDECRIYCQSFNNIKLNQYYHTCNAVHYHASGANAGLCTLYRYKPTGGCSSWVQPGTGYVAYIYPILNTSNKYGLCY